jgi:hypothetical protein
MQMIMVSVRRGAHCASAVIFAGILNIPQVTMPNPIHLISTIGDDRGRALRAPTISGSGSKVLRGFHEGTDIKG